MSKLQELLAKKKLEAAALAAGKIAVIAETQKSATPSEDAKDTISKQLSNVKLTPETSGTASVLISQALVNTVVSDQKTTELSVFSKPLPQFEFINLQMMELKQALDQNIP